ncbi:MAG TPA: DmsE family decaheme c-type cytochrome [Micropepsaceae bacterium]|nr:DmsE family decaheme c-type cytochrome [Micropepsaceae bacterium]
MRLLYPLAACALVCVGFVAEAHDTARGPDKACGLDCNLASEIDAYLKNRDSASEVTFGDPRLENLHRGVKTSGHAQTELADEIADYLKRGPSGTSAKLAPGEGVKLAAAAPAEQAQEQREYVGQQSCVSCHSQEAQNWAHTIHAKVFGLNPRNALESAGCEACHGPGSAHVRTPAAPLSIIRFSKRSQTPVSQQNAQCLTCHRGGQRIFWPNSVHESHDLACSDCHNPMANFSARGLEARGSVNETCFQCHKTQRAQFTRRSHMPLLEGKITCVDCHNPHGSTTEPLLKADSVNEVCYTCHAEKRGPFLFEHAPVRESCLNCHSPHGSNNEKLLVTARPILCQSCHAQNGHPAELLTRGYLANGPLPDVRLINRSCSNCHAQIHGSNSPAGSRFER